MRREDARRLMRAAGLVGGVLLALSPVVAWAQQAQAVYATSELYEVDETINCNPGGTTSPLLDPMCVLASAHGFGTRIANAMLTGTVDGPVEFRGPISIEASSILSQVDWTGPAFGKMLVQTPGGVVQANMAGQLDLSLLQKGSAPLAPISGKWQSTQGFGVGGTFSGVFQVPFWCGAVSPSGVCYMENGGMVPTSTALVKLVVTFYNR